MMPSSHPQEESLASPTAERVPLRLFALKEGDTFVVADAFGDIVGEGDGLFSNDTRILSHFRLLVGGRIPSLLSADVSQDNVFFTSHLTNRPLPPIGGRSMPEGVIHIERTRFIWHGRLYERLLCTNYADREAAVPIRYELGADFRDMFEVRGSRRHARGEATPPQVEARSVLFAYRGLDGVRREASVGFSETPERIDGNRADFLLELDQNGRAELYVEVCPQACTPTSRQRFRHAAAQARANMRTRRRRGSRVTCSNRLFTAWVHKSWADLALLTSDLPTGPYPYAGIPWFSTAFGRDAIITALQTLWLDYRLARGVLRFLAENQAQETSAFRDAEPGKIMHETRKGEMNALGELPFARYYGGVDTTPLFIMLAGAYADRTGDLALIRELWPALLAAAGWIESVCDRDPRGLLHYARAQGSGLANQGWKDSEDSVFHADAEFPRGPIALIEVQGYVYAAMKVMASLAERRGEIDLGLRWAARAQAVREAVERHFWMEDEQFYGIALDGEGRLCRVRSSNAGQLLFCGLPLPERAKPVICQLLTPAFDSGWGIRTVPVEAARFNPMSYHNGSVWPHDTSVCAAGIARYGEREGVVHVLGELFEAAVHFGMRLPELFCGFPRQPGAAPIAYPVACLPQAWAAGAVFMLLQHCLGIEIDGWRHEVRIRAPRLPDGVVRLVLRQLWVGNDALDLVFQRVGDRVVAFPEGRTGRVAVVIEP